MKQAQTVFWLDFNQSEKANTIFAKVTRVTNTIFISYFGLFNDDLKNFILINKITIIELQNKVIGAKKETPTSSSLFKI